MSRFRPRPTLALVLLLATAAHAADPAPVTVRFDHPGNFTETREVHAFAPSESGNDYLDTLARYIERRAASILAPGQHLEIVVEDVDRAGSYLPSLGSLHPVRIVEDLYPPRIRLRFRLFDEHGAVIREGERKLTDLAFLQDGAVAGRNTDPLRYEKRLIDRWLAKGPQGL
ncbi:DUF3016 domain-containing protein [Fulvimonas yonginensis]|uniref:DUF3016 domain-containing protein n=1 Tax=Fulvimonas yonginensis TaxID=1495200 RepID=A0ABU8JBU6_9GAMM